MAILHNCELWFPKLDPKRPNSKFNKENPTWEIQIRTYDREEKKKWEALGLSVKPVVPDEGAPYFKVGLRKKSIKADKTPASPVTVVNGALDPVEPTSIGNGSIGNVRIFQYDYPRGDGSKGLASVLMGIQLTKHIVFKAKPRDEDFSAEDTETVYPESEDFGDDIAF